MSHLRIVGADGGAGTVIADEDLPDLATRPGDRREPVRFKASSRRDSLIEIGAAMGLTPEQSIPLVVEALLILDDLHCYADLPRREALGMLGESATTIQGAQLPQGGAIGNYLRALLLSRPIPCRIPKGQLDIPLPTRVLGRWIGSDRELDPPILHEARSWEVASLVSGRTMTEWALLEAVGAGPT